MQRFPLFILTAMRKVITIPLLFFLIIQPICSQQRKTVAVVLMGGGAMGAAHVGALKVLEEAGIPIDYIVGTSMGGLVGALYAIGYDAHSMDSLMKQQDWGHLLSDDIYRHNLPERMRETDKTHIVSLPYTLKKSRAVKLPSGAVKGQNLYNLFLDLTTGYHSEISFETLPIPFACVAANARDGEKVVLNKGLLPTAMRATMAIPGFFSPVEKDSMLLIDGGVVDNYPVDVAKEMGADVIIGVVFAKDTTHIEENRGSMIELFSSFSNFMNKELYHKNMDASDLLIMADMKGYGMMSFTKEALDSIIHRGEMATREKWNELMALKKRLRLGPGFTYKKHRNRYLKMDTLPIRSVRVKGVSGKDEEYVLKSIKVIDRITRSELRDVASRIYATGLFSSVYYRLDNNPPFDLVFEVERKKFNALNIGVRFDTHDIASILLNTTFHLDASVHRTFDIKARLSKNPYLNLNFALNRGLFYKGGITYNIGRNDVDIYNRGELSYNFKFLKQRMDFHLYEFYLRDVGVRMGISMEYFHLQSSLFHENQASKWEKDARFYTSYFASACYDNLDRLFLPMRGLYVEAGYRLLTDNFYRLNSSLPASILNFRFEKPIKTSEKTSVALHLQARAVLKDSIAPYYANLLGGNYDGHLLLHQISLSGSLGAEVVRNTLLKSQIDFRYNLKTRHYLRAAFNFSVHNNEFAQLFDGQKFYGGVLGYSYMTLVGPLNVDVGYSSLSRKISPFVSFGYYF